jgi:hypothetical protein
VGCLRRSDLPWEAAHMSRPVTLFTAQWADLPFATMCQKLAAWGYDGAAVTGAGP